MAPALDIKLVKSIKELGQKYEIEKILLFGSRARGDNKPTSDIDLAIYPSDSFNKKGHFVSDLEDLDTLIKIDTIFINGNTDHELINNIEREGVILYESQC